MKTRIESVIWIFSAGSLFLAFGAIPVIFLLDILNLDDQSINLIALLIVTPFSLLLVVGAIVSIFSGTTSRGDELGENQVDEE